MKTKIREVVSELLTVDTKTRDDDAYLYDCVLRVLWVSWPIYYVLSTVDYQKELLQKAKEALEVCEWLYWIEDHIWDICWYNEDWEMNSLAYDIEVEFWLD